MGLHIAAYIDMLIAVNAIEGIDYSFSTCNNSGCSCLNPTDEETPKWVKEWMNPPIKTDTCTHEYKQYTGLIESYQYCVKCNEKL